MIIQVGHWLATEADLIDGPLTMARGWRRKLCEDWERITGEKIQRSRPRYTQEELTTILATLENPEVDPRMRLALEVGPEARLGQVRRSMRSGLVLDEVGVFGLGQLTVPGTGKKLGVVRDLTPFERRAVDRALGGYLAPLEAAFQSGSLEDFALFPAGRLRWDVAPSRCRKAGPPPVRRVAPEIVEDAERAAKPAGKRAFSDWFGEVERLAGIAHVEGRGWYGIRRVSSDVAEDHEHDERVLNDLSGHADSATRRKIYQERERQEIRARTAELRHRLQTEILVPDSPSLREETE